MYVIVVGPPGAGKGSQARALAIWLHIPYVATGDLFRTEIAAGTPLGMIAKTYMNHGELVPDETTMSMVLARLSQPDCQDGVLLDGFPRNLSQAVALDAAWAATGKGVDIVLHLQASRETVLGRLTNRWVCPKDGSVYNRMTKPPRVDNVCDLCGTTLLQRPDDPTETQYIRLAIYERETTPLLDYYGSRGLVHTVDAEQPMDSVAAQLRQAIDEVRSALQLPQASRTSTP